MIQAYPPMLNNGLGTTRIARIASQCWPSETAWLCTGTGARTLQDTCRDGLDVSSDAQLVLRIHDFSRTASGPGIAATQLARWSGRSGMYVLWCCMVPAEHLLLLNTFAVC